MKATRLTVQILLTPLPAIPAVAAPETSRPHLHLSKSPGAGATSLEEFRKAIREDSLLAARWKVFLEQTEHDVKADVILPGAFGLAQRYAAMVRPARHGSARRHGGGIAVRRARVRAAGVVAGH